ncbi:MAG: crosslink repair DNA glycosylase YcaQ family protein [Gammaproteobacteria bacterium]|nr:crosslink repair DNA glycosylase YcaQ family protein [Gammaproteobacteria bacterium]
MPPAGATTEIIRRLRRTSLQRQGLLQRAAFGTGLAGTRRAIEALGYVQIDTISVVSRAHDHVLQARVPGYRPELLDRLQADGSVFEYWAHAAAYLPMRNYRFALPRMHAMRAGEERWIRSRDQTLMRRVLDRVRLEGPLQTRDFEAPANARSSGWWDWKPAKRALEQLFMQGDLMVTGRSGFQKIYDLPERVLPDWVDTRTPTVEEYADHLIEAQLRATGLASVRVCVYQRQTPGLRQAVTRALQAAETRGELLELMLQPPNGPSETVYADPEIFATRAPPARATARLLSPFDNAVIHRQRALSLFDFDYQLECYVPEAKRRFGYFCLPVLYRDRLIGRADCKAHRNQAHLEVKRLFIEHSAWLEGDHEAAAAAVAEAFVELAAHNGCQAVTLGVVEPPEWRDRLIEVLP